MIPLSDDNPTLRTPVVTLLILATLGAVWVLVQGAGFDPRALAASICHYGMIPGALTGRVPLGTRVPLTSDLDCLVQSSPLTPLTSMFLHGGWGHILGNGLFFWVFGNNIEDSMGRLRFIVFYLVCGLAAAATHVLVAPASAVPVVGASGAISGILGAYLVLYPRVRVNMLFIIVIFIRVIPLPAWLVLLYWFGLQLLLGLPELMSVNPEVSSGVAVWAHIGGFITGALLIKLFVKRELVSERNVFRHRYYPNEP